jgi:CTP:molybdopterin cytidylyltransferase MocA
VSAPRHAAVLLAAGASRRLGQPKALVMVDAKPLVRRSARCLLQTAPDACFVVTGAADAALQIRTALAGLALTVLPCADWMEGMAASLRCAVHAAARTAVDAILVCPCDLPALRVGHLEALLGAWRAAPARPVASHYAGVAGAPAVLPRSAFAAILALRGDRGARDWLRAQVGLCSIPAAELAIDLDTPADLPAAH